jgi:hypothetical protein
MSKILTLFMIMSLLSCFSSPRLIDPGKSKSFFVQGNRYYYIQNGNRLASGKNELKNVSGNLIVIDALIARDDKKIFYKSEPQASADPNSFVAAAPLYKDAKHVYSLSYFKLEIIPNTDPGSFQYIPVTGANAVLWARDAKSYYLWQKPVAVDTSAFKIFNYAIAWDASQIYSTTAKGLIPVAQLSSEPEIISEHFFRDKEFLYFYSTKSGFQKRTLKTGSKVQLINPEQVSIDGTIVNAYS